MVEFIMMIGIPGSGKSTFASEMHKEIRSNDGLCFLLSSDEYRSRLNKTSNSKEDNAFVFETLYHDVETLVEKYDKSGKDLTIILDFTSVSSKDRQRTFHRLSKYRDLTKYKWTAYIMATPIELCIKRDSIREAKVGDNVIHKFVRRFEYPSDNEFSNVFIVTNTEPYSDIWIHNKLYYEDLENKMREFNQENPHHIFTLYEHSMYLYFLMSAYYSSNFDDIKPSFPKMVGFLHDVGKMDTQTFNENGIAHYYNHANYSAYRAMCLMQYIIDCCGLDFDEDDVGTLVFLINNHMKIRDIAKSNKSVEKHRTLWGDKVVDILIKFMELDNVASGTEIIN